MSTKKSCYEIPKDFVMVRNHATHVVFVKKQESSKEDKALKNIIKEDYKNVFKHILVVREDEIDKKDFDNTFRGRTVTSVEFRTLLPIKSYQKLGVVGCVMSSEIDRMKKRVNERIEEDARQK